MARSDMTVELTLTDAAKMLIAEAREQLELNDKERAVIEAAKAYRTELAGGYDGEAASAHKKLLLAVEALQEVKKDE